MIIVTGASGKLGRLIARNLLDHFPPEAICATARDPAKAPDLQALGIGIRAADYEDAASMSRAFAGATQVLMVSSNATVYGRDPISQHAKVISAARGAGVERLIYTSHMAASPTSRFLPMSVHDRTERLLAESGLAWTALRNGFYADSILSMVERGLRAGQLSLPVDGKVNWTAHADLAEAAAAVLAQPGRFEGPTPPLVAGDALDLADIAAIAGELLGHEVRREEISDDEMASQLAKAGQPPVVTDITLSMYRAIRAGEFTAQDATLAGLLGRPTTPLSALLAARMQG